VQSYYDVAYGIKARLWGSGLEHYCRYGHQEFRYINAGQAKRMEAKEGSSLAPEVAPKYAATLSWLGPVQLAANTICIDFKAENAGLAIWSKVPAGAGGMLIRAGARLFRDLGEVNRVPAIREYRLELPTTLCPGDSATFRLSLDRGALPVGRSFLLIDMVWEQRFWFAEEATVPLVLGMNRAAGVDDLELVLSEPPTECAPTAGTPVRCPRTALHGWPQVGQTRLVWHKLVDKLSTLRLTAKTWKAGA
jgi:hypothetical protein